MKRSYKLILAALIAVALLTSCDFAMPKADKPTVHLVTLALDYEGTGVGPLKATLNDQEAISEQFAYLAEEAGYEFEEYKFTQTGAVEASINLGKIDDSDPNKIEAEIWIDRNDDQTFSINYTATDVASWDKVIQGPQFIENGKVRVYLCTNELQEDVVNTIKYTIYLEDEVEKDTYNEIITDKTYAEAGDAQDYITIALQELGFKLGIKNTILSSFDQIKNDAKPGDLTFFCYSGHGAAMNGIEFNGSLALSASESISPYDLKRKILPIAGNKLIVLDSCYSGAWPLYFEFFEKPYTFSESLDTMLSIEVPVETNTWVISASRNFETSGDGGEGNCGLFTGQFLKALGAKMADPKLPEGVAEEDKEEYMKALKAQGILSFEEPGKPSGNSVWLSKTLNTARSALNPLGVTGTQEPTGDSYVDLQLFKFK